MHEEGQVIDGEVAEDALAEDGRAADRSALEVDEGPVAERKTRERRGQPRLPLGGGAPGTADGAEANTVGEGRQEMEHEVQKVRRQILPRRR